MRRAAIVALVMLLAPAITLGQPYTSEWYLCPMVWMSDQGTFTDVQPGDAMHTEGVYLSAAEQIVKQNQIEALVEIFPNSDAAWSEAPLLVAVATDDAGHQILQADPHCSVIPGSPLDTPINAAKLVRAEALLVKLGLRNGTIRIGHKKRNLIAYVVNQLSVKALGRGRPHWPIVFCLMPESPGMPCDRIDAADVPS